MNNKDQLLNFMSLSPGLVTDDKLPFDFSVYADNVQYYLNQLKSESAKNKYFPLDVISKKIGFLINFSELINKHPEELEKTYKLTIERENLRNYAIPLIDYMVLEIRDFYRNAYFIFETHKSLTPPRFPNSSDLVKEFRDKVVGHIEKKITQKELVEMYEKVNEYGGINKIFEEWQQFRDETFKWMNTIPTK